MNIFTWLLVGHLVGDWLLQNDWMVRGKKRGLLTWPGTIHFTIYTMVIIGTLWLSGARDKNPGFYLVLSTLVFVSHWLIDASNVVEYWMRFYRQSNSAMMRVMVDQILHILVLVIVTRVILLGIL
jgi:hypothetical protein